MGQPLIDRILDRLSDAGVEKAVVNTHHLAKQLERHLSGRKSPKIVLSHEDQLLDTGGGVANALAELGDEPFYVLNGDVFWLEGHSPALERLADAWDDAAMDALLLVHETVFAMGYEGAGDFILVPVGRARRRQGFEVAPFAFTGIQMLHPRLFRYAPDPPFSLNVLYDQAEAAERLFALPHDGMWFHIGTPHDLEFAAGELQELGFRAEHEEAR
jgi:MurNAc alpha-1-phosphate uridylyltransferase